MENEKITEGWVEFAAYNQERQYGYGTADEAEQYVDMLNEGRDINLYGWEFVDMKALADERGITETEADQKLSDYCPNIADNL